MGNLISRYLDRCHRARLDSSRLNHALWPNYWRLAGLVFGFFKSRMPVVYLFPSGSVWVPKEMLSSLANVRQGVESFRWNEDLQKLGFRDIVQVSRVCLENFLLWRLVAVPFPISGRGGRGRRVVGSGGRLVWHRAHELTLFVQEVILRERLQKWMMKATNPITSKPVAVV